MSTANSFAPVAAPSGTPLRLAMQRLWLGGQVLGAGARLVVEHVFRSEEERTLEAIYSFPLARDAALRAFRITGEGFEAHSELKPTGEAVEAYERGISDGSLSSLARQYGDGIVNLTVGNIRPGETVTVFLELLAGVEARDDGFRFRLPFTLAPAYHPRIRAAAIGDEAEMELPADQFGDVILPRWRRSGPLHEVGFELSVPYPHGLPIGEIGSPSHAIRVRQDGGTARVGLAPEHDVPDRDLVLDVRFAEAKTQVLAGPVVEGHRSFAAVVPSAIFGVKPEGPRRVVILLDRSGSMQGTPMAQARRAVDACLALFAEQDAFGLVIFDDRVESLEGRLLSGRREDRERARAFLAGVDARGGTELAEGFEEAARLLGGAGDILVLTDGQVFGTEEILAKARAVGARLSCLGIGSASQDRFLTLLARETGGISRFVTARERVDMAAVDLFASMGRPVAAGLKAGAGVRPEPAPFVFAGTPVVVFGETAAQSVELTWDSGRLSLEVPEGDRETGETVRLLRGARLIADWESRYPGEEALAPLKKRRQSRVATRLVELSQEYGLASREMSLVAVVERRGDQPGELPETRVVPLGVPQDVSLDTYLLQGQPALPAAPVALAAAATFGLFGIGGRRKQRTLRSSAAREAVARPSASASEEDRLLELAAEIEPDGGMPGRDAAARVARSICAVLAFALAGHTVSSGVFRSHVARLVAFLEAAQGVPPDAVQAAGRAIEAARGGNAPAGDWLRLARSAAPAWNAVTDVNRKTV